MKHEDAKHEQIAAELMRQIMGMAPSDEEATKGAQLAEQSLAERVKALKEERNTISRQMERKEAERRLKERKEEK
jgi:hypothetical protein